MSENSNLTDKRMIRTREAIRNAMLRLLGEKNPEDINITELTEIAHISRKTFYLHYSSINDVIVELESEIEQEVLSVLSQSILWDSNPSIYRILSVIDRIFKEKTSYSEYLKNTRARVFMMYHLKNAIMPFVSQKISSRYSTNREDLHLASDFALTGIISMYYDWVLHQHMTLAQLSEKAQQLWTGSLRAFFKANYEGNNIT